MFKHCCYSLSSTTHFPPTVFCYFESAATSRSGNAHFTAAQLPAKQCTHIVYTFIVPLATGQLAPFTDSATLDQLVALRSTNPALKVLAAVGGFAVGSALFSGIVGDPAARGRLVQSLVAFCAQHNLNGIDVDWSYPAQLGGVAADRVNFVAFVRELRAKLTWSRLLTAAVGASPALIGPSYDVPALSAQLSFINLLTFVHDAFDGHTALNAPLYAAASNPAAMNADASVRAWRQAGAPGAKIVLGLAFFGHSFQLANVAQTGIGAAAVGDHTPGCRGSLLTWRSASG